MSGREPICGFCWAYNRTYAYLEFDPRAGYWECPICLARSESPDDDEEEIRRELEREQKEKEGALYPHGDLAPLRKRKGGGGRSGRRRKTKKPVRRRPWPGTLA